MSSCSDLLIGRLALLYPAFFQREVVVEEEEQQMPQNSRLVQVGLQPEVDAEGTYALRHHCAQLRQVLRNRISQVIDI